MAGGKLVNIMTDEEFFYLQEAASNPWASYQMLIAYADALQERRPVSTGVRVTPVKKSEPPKSEREKQNYLDALAERANRPMLRTGIYGSHVTAGRGRRE